MKEWWQQRNPREQKLVLAMGLFFSVLFLYTLIWQPLSENLVKAEKKLRKQQELLTWVSENTQYFVQNKGNKNARTKGSLSSVVTRTAGMNNISIARMQPQGNDIQLWIDEVSFRQLLQWLEQLSSQENLHVKAIDLTHAEQLGTVRVRRLQLGKN